MKIITLQTNIRNLCKFFGALLFLAIFIGSVPEAKAELSSPNYYSDSAAVQGTLVRSDKIAEFGGTQAVLYVSTNVPQLNQAYDYKVYFKDANGNTSSLTLPGTQYVNFWQSLPYWGGSYNNFAREGILLTSPTDFWLFSGQGPVSAHHYQLTGSPLPTAATLISTDSFGGQYSYPSSFISLKSGGMVAAWFQNVLGTNGLYYSDLGISYRSPSGVWSTLPMIRAENLQLDSSTAKVKISVVQHPTDNSIWTFYKRDSRWQIFAAHFTESGNSLSLDWKNETYIDNLNAGENGPEGEFPDIVAIPDANRNVIHLAYENNYYQIFDANYFTKGAYVTIAEIHSDNTRDFINYPTYVERVSNLGLIASPDKLWLAYTPITQFVDCDLMATTYKTGAWTQPVWLGTVARGPAPNSYSNCISALDQVMIAGTGNLTFSTQLVDHKIHFFNMLTDVDPAIIPVPDTFPPTAYISAPMSAGDPEVVEAKVSGVYPVTVIAKDDNGVANVEFYLDGILQVTDSASPYVWNWDTTTQTDLSQHTLLTRAYDVAGNTRYFYKQLVKIDQSFVPSPTPTPTPTPSPTPPPDTIAPTVSITKPVNGASVQRSTKTTITATATDNVGVTRVEFLINGSVTNTDTAVPYSFDWQVPSKPNATYKISAKAYDAAGNSSVSVITVKSSK